MHVIIIPKGNSKSTNSCIYMFNKCSVCVRYGHVFQTKVHVLLMVFTILKIRYSRNLQGVCTVRYSFLVLCIFLVCKNMTKHDFYSRLGSYPLLLLVYIFTHTTVWTVERLHYNNNDKTSLILLNTVCQPVTRRA